MKGSLVQGDSYQEFRADVCNSHVLECEKTTVSYEDLYRCIPNFHSFFLSFLSCFSFRFLFIRRLNFCRLAASRAPIELERKEENFSVFYFPMQL